MPWPKGKPAHNRVEGPDPETYRCNKCKIEKPISDYHWKHGHRTCKECGKKKLDKTKIRNGHLLKTYGINLEDYDKMLADQNDRCAICLGLDPKAAKRANKFVVDHCHSTGAVRGLLCHACNRALGNFGDSIETLENAILYLKK